MLSGVRQCFGTGKRRKILGSVRDYSLRRILSQRRRKSVFSCSSFQNNRKRRRYKMFIVITAMLACNCPIERRFWMLTRSCHWFEMVETVFTDKEWYDINFRASKETFQNIVLEIEDEIVRKDTAMRKAISS